MNHDLLHHIRNRGSGTPESDSEVIPENWSCFWGIGQLADVEEENEKGRDPSRGLSRT
jgi:hypothetical protein